MVYHRVAPPPSLRAHWRLRLGWWEIWLAGPLSVSLHLHGNYLFVKTQKSYAFGPTVQTDPPFSVPKTHLLCCFPRWEVWESLQKKAPYSHLFYFDTILSHEPLLWNKAPLFVSQTEEHSRTGSPASSFQHHYLNGAGFEQRGALLRHSFHRFKKKGLLTP